MLYRSSASSGTVLHIHDAVVDLIKPPQAEGAEVDGEDPVPDGLEADLPAFEKGADEDLPVIPTHGVVSGDASDREVAGVLDGRRPPGKGSFGRMVELRRKLHVEGLVGALEVIDPTKVIEPSLLGGESRAGSVRRKGGALLERPVHTFMASILVGFSGLDALGKDAEGDPPDGELGEASDGGGREGMPVVATDPTWEAEGAEETPETAHCGFEVEPLHASARQEKPGMTVLNGEWIAQLPIAGPKLPLEVRGPGTVGLRQDRNGRTGVRSTASRLAALDTTVALEDPSNRIGTRHVLDLGVTGQLPTERASTPPVFLARLEDASHRRGWCRVRTGMRATGPISQPFNSLFLETSNPLVAGRAADPMSPAQLGVREVGDVRLDHEAGAFVFHGLGPPRHRALPVGGAPVYMETCKPSARYVL